MARLPACSCGLLEPEIHASHAWHPRTGRETSPCPPSRAGLGCLLGRVPMPASYLSPKTRIARSPIHGRGLFAAKTMRQGETVAIKGGHVLDRQTLRRVRRRIAESYVPIADDFYIGAVRGR